MMAGICRRAARGSSRNRAAERGAVALMTVLLLPVLFGFGAFVIDLARMYVYKTEIQNAMDGCALAASLALTGDPDDTIFDRARAYGRVVLDPSAASATAARPPISVNRLHFQHDNFGLDSARLQVVVSSALSGPWVSSAGGGVAAQDAKFARCAYTDPDNPLLFLPLLRAIAPTAADKLTVAAYATAGLTPSQSACALPIGVCIAPGGTAANNWGIAIGTRLTSVTGSPPTYGPGQFGWLDFTPPSGGASELAEMIKGSGSCAVKLGDQVGEAGAITSLQHAWNSRFGLYGPGSLSVSDAPPDFTGYGYSPPASSNYADYEARYAARAPFNAKPPGSWKRLTNPEHTAYGQRRRVATVPVVNCAEFASGMPKVQDLACVLLLAPIKGSPAGGWPAGSSATIDIEFLGRASTPGTPCVSYGLAGGTFGPPVPTLVQ